MIETQKEQYEALQYVWHLGKKYNDEEDGLQKFRDHICEILRIIAEEGAQDFKQYLSDLNRGLY